MTVKEIVDRIKHAGATTALHSGSADAPVQGVAVTYTPSLEVLRKAAASGRNLIVAREGPYWMRKPESVAANPTYVFKRDFIDKHGLAILQLRDLPQGEDRHLQALAEALGWENGAAGGTYFTLPENSLDALAKAVEAKLRIRAARVIGDPRTAVRKVALTHGRLRVPELQRVLREPGVDAVVVGEPIEWEAGPYFQDLIASGQKKGMIAIGLEASEEPGGKLLAAWLQSVAGETAVEWIPAGEPFWVLQ